MLFKSYYAILYFKNIGDIINIIIIKSKNKKYINVLLKYLYIKLLFKCKKINNFYI